MVEDLQNGTSYHYYYSNEGVLLNEKAVKDGTTSYSRFYDYDDEGRLIEQWNYYSYGIDKTSYTRYFYNSDGAITRVEQNGNFESYSYDEFGRLVSISVNSNQSTANELEKVYTYIDTDTVATSRIQGEVISYGGNETDISYSYDLNGNIYLIENNEKIISYKYDESNQLIREDNEMLDETYVYTYDSAGNITKRQTYAFTTSSTLTSPISEDVYSYGDNSWGDLLTSYNGVNFTYDQIGNPLTYYNGSSHSMTWQNGRELASIDGWEFKYNSDGVRIEKSSIANRWEYVVNGTRIEKEYLYFGDTLFSDTSYYYDANGYASSAIMSFYSQGEIVTYKYLFVTNLQGDVIAVTDENGVWLITYTYDAWGNFTPEYNYDYEDSQKVGYGIDLPFRYRSYYYDSQTGFYYLNSRYYDSKLCRFINADGYVSTGQGLTATNMFAYCGNNPVMYVDPTGEFFGILSIIAVKAVIKIVVAVAIVVAVNHAVTAIECAIAESEVEDEYTKDEAKAAIEEITGEDTVTVGDEGVHIENSNEIRSRYEQIYVSKILQNTVDSEGEKYTNRTTYGLMAEWAGHNFLYNYYLYRDVSVQHVDLDYDFWNNEWYTILGTIVISLFGGTIE